jgi:TetR/AcrR family transcriptional repressor of nem operon
MRKGQETRERIAAQAAAVFNVAGYAGTAISDIMAATGLEKGGIYRHFENKEQLALAAFDYASAQVRERFAAGLSNQTHAADQLIAFLRVFRSYAENPPIVGGCPILNTAIESDDTNPALRERTKGVVQEWRSTIQAIVHTGIAHNQIHPNTDADKLALVLIASMEGAVMLAKLLGDPAPLEQAYQHLCAYIERDVRLV